jgi:hypothetical protein|tara:strand:+ start:4967 stop:5449 length:483 start_codon:yes stop_codon:yes gene_type:complete
MSVNNEIKRTSRSTETRVKRDMKKNPWTPPSNLDAPRAPDGYHHRWLRAEAGGFLDTANMSKKLREGYELVRSEELTAQIGDHDYPVIADGKHAGVIGVGGLLLARIPEEIVESRSEYFQGRTSDQQKAVDNDLMKEQRPEMPINIDRQSRVTFGGSKKK